MKYNITNAVIVSLLGVAILFLLGRFLNGLVGSVWDLSSRFLGALITTLLFAKQESAAFRAHLFEAVPIVFGTLIFISIGHALSQVYARNTSVDFEPVGKFMWATFMTSWWLIPGTAGVLTVLSRTQKR